MIMTAIALHMLFVVVILLIFTLLMIYCLFLGSYLVQIICALTFALQWP